MTPYQQAVYNLFERNWKNHIANEPELTLAVSKGLLTQEQADTIMAIPR